MDVEEVGGGCGDWMELAQVAGTCEYGEVSNSIKMWGISWLAAKTDQLLKKDCAVWSE
jgi:hypothetical protein